MSHVIEKYDALFNFFYSILKDSSEDGLAMFKELLNDLKIDADEIRKAKIEDEGMKRALKDIGYSKKIRKALENDEPPEHVKGYINIFLAETSAKAKAFFAELKPEPKSYSVKDRFENAIEIIASRELFQKDKRIIADEEDVFRFELSCYYSKEKKRLGVTMSVRFKVEESEVAKIGSPNLTLFDKFISSLGLEEGFNKNVQFSATISEGQTISDNTCEAYWSKELEM